MGHCTFNAFESSSALAQMSHVALSHLIASHADDILQIPSDDFFLQPFLEEFKMKIYLELFDKPRLDDLLVRLFIKKLAFAVWIQID